jgi:hypothetical protein
MKVQKMWVLGFLVMVALPSYASVNSNVITNDTEIYDRLHEIRVQKRADLDFQTDAARLVAMEPAYRENLKLTRQRALRKERLEKPLKRIRHKKARS